MFRIQSNRPGFRGIVSLSERVERGVAKTLLAAEKIAGAPLCYSAIDVGRLIFEMKDEPELDAWIRNRDVYPVRFGLRDRGKQVRMRVLVKYAPDFIPRRAAPPPLFALSFAFRRNRVIDQCHRNPMLVGDNDSDLSPISPMPVHDVLLFGAHPLDEDEQLALDLCTRDRSRWPRGTTARSHRVPLPVAISSAICRKRSFEMMGVAP
jgi:hypothetical protein